MRYATDGSPIELVIWLYQPNSLLFGAVVWRGQPEEIETIQSPYWRDKAREVALTGRMQSTPTGICLFDRIEEQP